MTSFDLNDIIIKLQDVISEMYILKNKMEGRTNRCFSKQQRGRCKGFFPCVENGNMKSLKVNLNESANYFIQLFYATGMKYSCTRTKIGKLLSILSFKYARREEKLFEEAIYKYDDCGTAIRELTAHVDRDVYIRCLYEDDGREYIEDIDDTINPDMATKYCCTNSLTEDVRRSIVEVFRKFASFSPRQLGEFINPIVNHDGVTRTDGVVDLSIFYTLEKKDFETDLHSKMLIDYLF